MSSRIRWLHISDIHYLTNADSARLQTNIENKLKTCFSNATRKVDCIIVTGDFFYKGEFQSSGQAKDCVSFLKRICEICLKENNNWKQHVFFCPGNHDLVREATRHDAVGNRVLTRKEEIKKAKKSSPNRMIPIGSDVYRLLSEDSFWVYQQTIYRQLRTAVQSGNLEYSIFRETVLDDASASYNDVFFIGVNTALYAGQELEKDEIKLKIMECRNQLQEADNKFYIGTPDDSKTGYEKANKVYEEYLKLHRELVFGEAHDKEKLCFISESSEELLKKELELSHGNYPIYLFFGHHPLSWLTDDAKKRFGSLMVSCSSGNNGKILYLCGHEHRPRVDEISITYEGNNNVHVLELGVGGNFADPSGWNIPSFAVDEISFNGSGDATLKGTIYCWCKTLDKESVKYADEEKVAYGWKEIEFGGIGHRIEFKYYQTMAALPYNTPDIPSKPTETQNPNKVNSKYDVPDFGNGLDF